MSGSDVEISVEAAALRVLGYGDPVAGPVDFGGVRFWASIDIDDAELTRRRTAARDGASSGGVGRGGADGDDAGCGGVGALTDPGMLGLHLAAGSSPAVRLRCCLVSEPDPASGSQQASLLAGYAPRAILVNERVDGAVDVLAVAMGAAVLDQGAVVRRPDGRLEVVATPGPRAHGRGLDLREAMLRETVYAAWLAALSADSTAERGRMGLPRASGVRGVGSVRASR